MALPQRAVGEGQVAAPELKNLARPVSLARERTLPVLPALAGLLPEGGLRRGSTVAVSGATSLALALLAGPSQAGSWCAAVGLPSLGVVAAAEVGVALERFPLVARPGDEWPAVVAALVDAVDVVLVCLPRHVRNGDARRLMAKARDRGAVLITTGGSFAADVRLAVASSSWEGLGKGHGRLRARRIDVVASGRGAAARERQVSLWLPSADGGVEAIDRANARCLVS
ncbi:MAG: hypothetical protein JO248_01470 [Acidimicrobiia bacterium]|nr:hypothetical protein [Acidimicrobiia bacterium]MBV9283498.1 hypothetical protein [Acidimicrobiia bacterium]